MRCKIQTKAVPLPTELKMSVKLKMYMVMKKSLLITMAVALVAALQSCNAVTDENMYASQNTKNFNICLIIDGTDRLNNQNGIPQVTNADIENLTRAVITYGKGSLYVSYVDNDCDNNKVAVFTFDYLKPKSPDPKKDYQTVRDYDTIKNNYRKKQDAYNNFIKDAIDQFSTDCSRVTDLAYSNYVAKQKKGSDVNGALNQASRLLSASQEDDSKSYIILVSDGCDNVGKELKGLPKNTELLIVNTNVSKHDYNNIVTREFVTLNQASNYIFK